MVARTRETAADMRSSYEALKKPERREMALADLDEALRQGAESGPAQDGLLESHAWGFELETIRGDVLPTLLWHGEADDSVPLAVGRYVADHIAGCHATFIDGESHTLLRRHWRPILEALVAAGRRPAAPADASRL